VFCCQKYLGKFGYLGETKPGEESGPDDEKKFKLAVRNFQKFAGLNTTGK